MLPSGERSQTTGGRAERQRNQVLVKKEKLGICDVILAPIQTEPEITFPGLCNYRSQFYFLCT